jgi:hypothetical protein
MKTTCLLLLLAALALPQSACRKRNDGAVPAAPATAAEPLDLPKLNAKIREFTEAFGKPPTTLQEMVDKKFIPSLPQPPPGRAFHYDPKTMQVQLQ